MTITGNGKIYGSGIGGGVSNSGAGSVGQSILDSHDYTSISDLFKNLTKNGKKNYEIVSMIKTAEDLLVLSCVWQRLKQDPDYNRFSFERPTKLLDDILFIRITTDDREKASTIRNYYSKKIVMWKLLGKPLTLFREDLNTFIASTGTENTEKFFGLVYYLPYLYDYDIDLDSLMMKHNTKIEKPMLALNTKSLMLQETFNVNRRLSKRKEYWFSDNNDNLVKLSVKQDNPLLSLLDVYTTTNVKIQANYVKNTMENRDYYEARAFRFV